MSVVHYLTTVTQYRQRSFTWQLS